MNSANAQNQSNANTTSGLASIASNVIDGITYLMPIENWSDDQVLDYVRESGLLPAHYDVANTSLDCVHCTAFLSENKWKLKYMDKHHPSAAHEVRSRLNLIRAEIEADMLYLEGILNG